MVSSRLPDGRVAVLLSAHDKSLLGADATALAGYLDRHRCEVAQVAAQLIATRRVRRHRAVIRAADRDELAAGLWAVAEGRPHPLVERCGRRTAARTAFVFPGQGSQWPGMGADAYRSVPGYRAEADRLDAAFLAAGLPSPLAFLTIDAGADTETDTVSQLELQGAQFVHSVALASVWRSCGIVPDLTLGHSLGEVAAGYAAEVITLDDAIAVIAARAHAIEAIPGRNGVAVLGVDPARAAELIDATAGWLELSAVNASESVAVAGDRDAIGSVVAAATARGLFARELAMSFPAHTSAMDPQRDELLRRLPHAGFGDSAVQFIGSATGALVAAGTDFGPYWYANLRNTIRFDRAAQSAIAGGAGTFVEMSAHPSLLFAVEDAAERAAEKGADPAVVVGSGHRDQPIADCLAANITAAAVADPGYRWADLLDGRPEPLRGFPGAPMRSEHLWATAEPLPPAPSLTVVAERWRQHLPRTHPAGTTRSVAVLGLQHDGPLVSALRDVVDSCDGAALTDAAAAEVVLAVAFPPASTDIAGVVSDLADRIDAGLLDYVDAFGPRCRDVWLVTVGAETVAETDPVPDPGQAAVAAMHRSLGFEFADQSFHHVDLPAQDPVSLLAAVVDVALRETGELAVRREPSGPAVYRRTLGEDASSASPWPANSGVLDNVVITGGSGAIGLNFARTLADRGARRIVLLSRRGGDPAVLADLSAQHGAEIVAPRCDITDADQLAGAAVAHAGGAATLVIHAAGIASFADRSGITGRSLVDMSAAKLAGLARFTKLWPLATDARIMLCSSVTGVWGGKGVAAYAAANRMLDVMAARLRADGHHCTAVRWGLWEGSGIVDAAEIARVERTGLRQMSPGLAVAAGLHDYREDPLVLAADPVRLQMFFGGPDTGGAGLPGLVAPAASPDEMVGDGEATTAPAAVRSQLAAVLDVEADLLDLDSSLFDLGVDSLLALDLRKRLKRLTGHTVPLARLLGGITATDLIAELSEKVESSRD
ncbi:mycobactin polyketide synthase MbtD [Mycolicibacterium hippocampi]|uniref:Polyketide synthase n=1 Tax=Mycolicibacterium hippocampi TaxID=659824 RepID=A0A7I9ZTK1_9MYCO|nr:mycobactin polyketide synthase MbtD [Mycolicibacterium hippocampi]GFH04018.1 polyketide synthase [Mycolicibacterium hippocampi]